MNKKELIKKFSDLLKIPEEKQELAFEIFLRELSDKLVGNQALRISSLGVFQVKREPVPREERKISGEVKNFLLFSPVTSEEDNKQTIYLQFEIPDYTRDTFEYTDDIFSLSEDKPLAPIKQVESETEKKGTTIFEKINGLLNESEIVNDLDILSIVYSKSKTEDYSSGEKAVEKSVEESRKEEEKDKKITDETIEIFKEAEEELKTPGVEEEISVTEEAIPDEPENKDVSEIEKPEAPDIIEEEAVEKVEESKAEEEKKAPQEVIEETEEDPFKEVEETINEVTEEPSPVPDETLDKIVQTQELKTNVVDNEEKPPLKNEKENEPEKKKKNKKLIYYSVTLVVIILIYFLFFTKGSKTNKKLSVKKTVDTTKVAVAKKPIIVAKKDTARQIVPENIKPEESTKITPGLAKNKQLYRVVRKERKITNRVFYDGKEYMVQISSWRNPKFAEREVKRLRKKGLDAFIVKAYIKKFKKVFNRVRIGGFKNKKEAIAFSKKNIY